MKYIYVAKTQCHCFCHWLGTSNVLQVRGFFDNFRLVGGSHLASRFGLVVCAVEPIALEY